MTTIPSFFKTFDRINYINVKKVNFKSLTHFMPLVFSYNLWDYQKNSFSVFRGV